MTLALHSPLRQFHREPASHKPFEFYRSSTVRAAQSSSISNTGGWLIVPPPHAKKLSDLPFKQSHISDAMPRTNQLNASRLHFIRLHILQVKTLPCIQCIPWLNRFFSSPSGNDSTPSRRSVASDTLRIQPAVRSCSPLTR